MGFPERRKVKKQRVEFNHLPGENGELPVAAFILPISPEYLNSATYISAKIIRLLAATISGLSNFSTWRCELLGNETHCIHLTGSL